jgi:hypothetical protein
MLFLVYCHPVVLCTADRLSPLHLSAPLVVSALRCTSQLPLGGCAIHCLRPPVRLVYALHRCHSGEGQTDQIAQSRCAIWKAQYRNHGRIENVVVVRSSIIHNRRFQRVWFFFLFVQRSAFGFLSRFLRCTAYDRCKYCAMSSCALRILILWRSSAATILIALLHFFAQQHL